MRKSTAKVRARAKEDETTQWRTTMHQKATLELWHSHRQEIGRMYVYDNSSGTGLIFDARAGALRTILCGRRYYRTREVQAAKCRACGVHEEDTEHLVLICHELIPIDRRNATLRQAFGFGDGIDNATEVRTALERLQLSQPSAQLRAAVARLQETRE